jgi:hypothetical protein
MLFEISVGGYVFGHIDRIFFRSTLGYQGGRSEEFYLQEYSSYIVSLYRFTTDVHNNIKL